MDTIVYERIATRAKDGADGVLYRHQWDTGYQELIFPTHQHAQDWINAEKMRQAVQPSPLR